MNSIPPASTSVYWWVTQALDLGTVGTANHLSSFELATVPFCFRTDSKITSPNPHSTPVAEVGLKQLNASPPKLQAEVGYPPGD